MKFTEFFWDFDGTLFDTYPRINRAMMKALNDLGVNIETEALAKLTKVTIGHAASVLLPGQEKEVMLRYREHIKEETIDSFIPYEGAFRMLKSVCEHGGRNYLYTHSGNYTIDVLKHLGADHLFADFITGSDGFPSKPFPDALLSMMEKHSLDPLKCVMVGDRDIDLLAGKNAGISGIMFDPDGYYADFDTQYRYHTFFDMMADQVWEMNPADLHVSDMYTIQRALQQRHPEWGGLHPGRARDQLLWMIGEAGEVIDILKKCKLQDVQNNPELRARFVEEVVDVAMYMNEVCMCLGITPEEFSDAYFKKHLYNMNRDYRKANKERYGS
ncbi:MAG: HAD-IA family hydrolase [Clostridia bacterium]|nr:HAD-IA family hydrolase [Clostridia bacterium]